MYLGRCKGQSDSFYIPKRGGILWGRAKETSALQHLYRGLRSSVCSLAMSPGYPQPLLCRLCFCITIGGVSFSSLATAQEPLLELLPLRPFNFDVALRQQTFAPNDREITLQAGLTALRYGDAEVRVAYQYFSIHAETFKTDQHAVFLNPRWNNVLNLLDLGPSLPIGRVLRHVLFGPLEDRAVPYIGGLLGTVISHEGGPPGLLGLEA